MIHILSLPSAARAALNYTPPYALRSGTRYVSLNAIVNTVSGGKTSATDRADKLLAKVLNGIGLPAHERAEALLKLGRLRRADIPMQHRGPLDAAIKTFVEAFEQENRQAELAFAGVIANTTWSNSATCAAIDFPNTIYERFPPRLKMLAVKTLASRWGYDHVYVRHIMSDILAERDTDTIATALQELLTAGIEATIFLPELTTLYATPAIHGLQTLLNAKTLQDLEMTISIMSGAVVYALTSHLREFQNAWQDTDATRGILRHIERRAEPAPNLAIWLIPYLEEISQRQKKAHGPTAALWTDTTIRRLQRWNGEGRTTRRELL